MGPASMNLTQVGIASLVVIVTISFLKFLKDERIDRKEERDSFLNTIQNHVEHNTDATRENTQVLEQLHLFLKDKIE